MKTCLYCKEEVRDDALKCRYCQSSFLPSPTTAVESKDDRHVTYVVDKDLIRFAKFSAAVLAVFLVVGTYLFGFKLEATVERVNALQKDGEKATDELKKSQAELHAAKSTVAKLKDDVANVLTQARSTLDEISKQRDVAIAMVVSIRELSPAQEQDLTKIKSAEPGKVQRDGKLWAVGTTIRIGFIGGTPVQRDLVKKTATEWVKYANLKFEFVNAGNSDVRIAFDTSGGSWSFVGTDVLVVPKKEATMNLGWTERDNILHEFGHVLGLIEEHQNPRANIKWDVKAVKVGLKGPPNFWSEDEIQEKVFKKIPKSQVGDYRDFDPHSIMTFAFPPEQTGGLKIGGASDLSESDKQLVQRLYPR